MKKWYISLAVILLFIFGLAGCNVSNESNMNSSNIIQEESVREMSTTVPKEDSQSTVEEEMDEGYEQLSDKEVTLTYEGELFTKSVFCVGKRYLYICGINSQGEYFLGSLEKEKKQMLVFPIEIPNDMRIIRITTDEQDRCHVLWFGVEKVMLNDKPFDSVRFGKSYITIINKDGVLENTIDLSKVFAKECMVPFNFIVDPQGNYYFENEDKVLRVSSDGQDTIYISCEGIVEGIGCGKSGDVYCTCRNQEGNVMLIKLVGEKSVSCDQILPSTEAIYANIEPGATSELLLYNKAAGVFSYMKEDSKLELRVEAGELPVSEKDVNGYGFLSDGRFCIMESNNRDIKFYYIPVGE